MLYQRTTCARSLRTQYVTPLTVQMPSEPFAKPFRNEAGTSPLFSGASAPVPCPDPHEAALLSAVKVTSGQPERARPNSDILVLKVCEPFASLS